MPICCKNFCRLRLMAAETDISRRHNLVLHPPFGGETFIATHDDSRRRFLTLTSSTSTSTHPNIYFLKFFRDLIHSFYDALHYQAAAAAAAAGVGGLTCKSKIGPNENFCQNFYCLFCKSPKPVVSGRRHDSRLKKIVIKFVCLMIQTFG